jgi:putative flippase GtrA
MAQCRSIARKRLGMFSAFGISGFFISFVRLVLFDSLGESYVDVGK